MTSPKVKFVLAFSRIISTLAEKERKKGHVTRKVLIVVKCNQSKNRYIIEPFYHILWKTEIILYKLKVNGVRDMGKELLKRDKVE